MAYYQRYEKEYLSWTVLHGQKICFAIGLFTLFAMVVSTSVICSKTPRRSKR